MEWNLVAPAASALAAFFSAWTAWKLSGRNARLVIADINKKLTTGEVARARELYSEFEWEYLQRGKAAALKKRVTNFDEADNGAAAEEWATELFNKYYTLVGVLERSVQRIQTIKPSRAHLIVGRWITWILPSRGSVAYARAYPYVEEEIREYLGWSLAQIIAWLHLARNSLPHFENDSKEGKIFQSSDESIAKCQRRLDNWGYVSTRTDVLENRLESWGDPGHSGPYGQYGCELCKIVANLKVNGPEY